VTQYVPPGWPAGVHPPGSEEFERSAIAWLLEVVPTDYLLHGVLRRHPVALATLARHHLQACVDGARSGYRTARTELGPHLPPAAIEAVLTAYRNGFPSAESDHMAPIRLTDPDWFPIRPHFGTDVLTTVENCMVSPCTHSGLMLQINSALILPGAYEGVWAPLGDQIAFVKNVRGRPHIYTDKISPVAEFSPVFLTDGTETDWQPTAPFPPLAARNA
jgi:hypothetical protein